jgi:hypothetical protein
MSEIEVEARRSGEVRISITDRDAALALAQVLAEASQLKEGPDGRKQFDVGWLEMFEDLNQAISGAWPDCTCDLLCPVHADA